MIPGVVSGGFTKLASTSFVFPRIELQFEGADGATVYEDEGIGSSVWTAVGTAPTLTTTSPLAGTSSLSIPSGGGSGIETPVNDSNRIPRFGDFSVKFKARASSWLSPASTGCYILSIQDAASSAAGTVFAVATNSSQQAILVYSDGTTRSVGTIIEGTALATNVDLDFEVRRVGNVLELLVNGVLKCQVASFPSMFPLAPGVKWRVGVPEGATSGPTNGMVFDAFTLVVNSESVNAFDEYFEKVVALLHFDGANNGTSFVDHSAPAHAFTASNAITVTADSKFGTASGEFLSGSSRTLTSPSSADWDLGSGDFTIEGWIKKPTHAAAFEGILVRDAIGGTRGWLFIKDYPGHALKFGCFSGGTEFSVTDTIAMPTNAWVHVAATREGGTLRLFRNGMLVASRTDLSTSAINSSGTPLCFGDLYGTSAPNPSTYLDGLLDDWRITKGVARYTEDFVVPKTAMPNERAPAVADTSFSNVLALLHMDGANSGTSFLDSSSFNRTVTATSVVTNTTRPRFGSASAFFDGSSDVLTLPDSANWDFGLDDVTVEMWIKPTNVSGIKHLFGRYSSPAGMVLQQRNAKLHLLVGISGNGGAWSLDAPATVDSLTADKWSHVVMQRRSGAFRLYCDGLVVLDSATLTGAPLEGAIGQTLRIGNNSFSDQAFAGYIDELRITRGVARYPNPFTPPETSFSNFGSSVTDASYSSVALLLHADGADGSTTITDNSPTPKTNTAKGDAALSTRLHKFGSAALKFNPSGLGLIQVADHADLDLTADFTIELWYFPTTIVPWGILMNRGGGIGIAYPAYQLNIDGSDSNGYLNFSASSSNAGLEVGAESGATGRVGQLVAGQWHHIAITRQGNTWRTFLNGVAGWTTTASNVPYDPSPRGLTIGGRYDGSPWGSTVGAGTTVAGYIDEVRISKGVSRYNAAFTPPVAPGGNSMPVGTLMLDLRFEGADGSTTVTDSSTYARSISNSGATIRTAQHSEGASSIQFTGQKLEVPTSTDFDFGSDSFAIELDIYPNGVTGVTRMLMTTRASSGSDPGFLLWQVNDGLQFTAWGPTAGTQLVQLLVGSGVLTDAAWNRVKVQRIGNTFQLLHNGVVIDSDTGFGSIAASTNVLMIGRDPSNPSRDFNGYMDRLTVYKGGTGV